MQLAAAITRCQQLNRDASENRIQATSHRWEQTNSRIQVFAFNQSNTVNKEAIAQIKLDQIEYLLRSVGRTGVHVHQEKQHWKLRSERGRASDTVCTMN